MADSSTVTTPKSRPHPLSVRERMALKNGAGPPESRGVQSVEQHDRAEQGAVGTPQPEGMVEAFLSLASAPNGPSDRVVADSSVPTTLLAGGGDAREASVGDNPADIATAIGIVGSVGSGADYAVPVPTGWFERPTPTRMERRAVRRKGFLETVRGDAEVFSVAVSRRDIVFIGSGTVLGLFVGSILL